MTRHTLTRLFSKTASPGSWVRVHIISSKVERTIELRAAMCDGVTPLFTACEEGHTEVASLLLTNGAAVNQAKGDGITPLYIACYGGHTEVASLLLTNGAAVNQADGDGTTPLFVACQEGSLALVKLLSSYSASRTLVNGMMAEQVADRLGHSDVVAWLTASRLWGTPLHHLDVIDAERARALLRDGVNLHAAAAVDGPTPLTLARALHAAGGATEGTAAHLVLQAAASWSEQTHNLFPATVRAHAVVLMVLGHRLSRQERFFGQEVSLFDVWMHHVMPHAINR